MSAWRQVFELAIEEEDLLRLRGDSAVANGTGEPGRAGADAPGLSRQTRRSLRWAELWACIIRPSSAVWSARLPMVRWRHSTTVLGPAKSRTITAEAKGLAGGSGLPEGQGVGLST